jgi:Tol biopolymer transport system component
MAQPLTGDYRSFEHVLMHEMVHQFQYDIFARGKAGANIQQYVQVNPPLWYMEGMAEFLSLGYDHPQTDAWLRDAAINGNLPTIKQMTEEPEKYFPYRFGFALWQYIGQRWGDEIVGEIMNAVPSLGVERAFRRELGMSLEDLSDEWHESVQNRFLPGIASLERPRKFAQPLLTQRRTGGVADLYIAPALSPDGKYIAFISYGSLLRGEVFPDLYLADAQTGKRLKRLVQSTTNTRTEELRQLYSQASFSPDGKLLAYVAQTKGKDVLYLLDVARRETIRSFEHLPLEGVTSPSWSPDGKQLVFSGNEGGITDLYVVNADGTGMRQLTHDRNGDVQPAWSPDGKTIAFASDRETDFDVLRLARWTIALYDVASGAITELPRQAGLNINPQWAPDGRSIAYVSDRTGTANLFLYDLDAGEHYQLTNVMGAVNALTEYSPAITWAHGTDVLAFTYYEKGTNNVWSIKNPRLLKRAPFRETPTTVAVRDTAPVGTVVAPDTVAGRRSVYRAPSGPIRPSALVGASPSAPAAVTVTAMLDSAALALPDTTRFREYKYAAGFQPEYVSQPSVGYGANNFGQGVFGGTTIVLSDLLGNQQLAFSGAINGRISDAMVFASYANLGRRFQYTTGLSQMPYYLLGDRVATTDNGQQAIEDRYLRYVQRDAFATGLYPLDRFRRFEFGMRASSISQSQITVTSTIDNAGFITGQRLGKGVGIGTAWMLSPSAAFVSDNALYGYTSPLMGHRYRVQFAPSVGSWRWLDYLVDARRYDPILFNFLTVATRFTTSITAGRDETRFRKYIGRADFVRGYDRQAYDTYFCSGDNTPANAGDQCGALQLFGSRVAFANAELRFPLLRRVDLGLLPIALPPIEGAFFYDAGLAWDGGMKVSASRPANYDQSTMRFPLRSYGFGMRFNLFGFVVLRWDYAKPLDAMNKKAFGTWSFGPAF